MQSYVRNQAKLTKEAYIITAPATQVLPYDGFLCFELLGNWDGYQSGTLNVYINEVKIAEFHYVNQQSYPCVRQYIPVRKGDTIRLSKIENPISARTIEALWYKQRDYSV